MVFIASCGDPEADVADTMFDGLTRDEAQKRLDAVIENVASYVWPGMMRLRRVALAKSAFAKRYSD